MAILTTEGYDEFIKEFSSGLEDLPSTAERITILNENVKDTLTELQRLKISNEQQERKIAELRDTNQRLFLQTATQSLKDEEPQEEKRKFEDLFNEKGELK